MKSCPAARDGIGVNISLVVLHYFPAEGQTNACAFVLLFTMQPLKNTEYLFCMLLVEPDSIVSNLNMMVFSARVGNEISIW